MNDDALEIKLITGLTPPTIAVVRVTTNLNVKKVSLVSKKHFHFDQKEFESQYFEKQRQH